MAWLSSSAPCNWVGSSLSVGNITPLLIAQGKTLSGGITVSAGKIQLPEAGTLASNISMSRGTILDADESMTISGTVTDSGDFRTHTFTGDGNFVVSKIGNAPVAGAGPAVVDYLVVAGGGGSSLGGGGAGGYNKQLVSATHYGNGGNNNFGGGGDGGHHTSDRGVVGERKSSIESFDGTNQWAFDFFNTENQNGNSRVCISAREDDFTLDPSSDVSITLFATT